MSARTRPLVVLVAVAVLASGCSSWNPFRKPPVETLIVGGGGFVMLSAGMILLQHGERECRDMERETGNYDLDCTADDATKPLAITYMATGFVAWMVAVGLMYWRRGV